MKKIIIAAVFLATLGANAQTDELKGLKKIYSKDKPSASDVTEFKSLLTKLEPLATAEGDKVYLNYYKAILPQIEIASLGSMPSQSQLMKMFNLKTISDLGTGYYGMLEYEKKTGKKVFTDDIKEDFAVLSPILINIAMDLGNAKKNKEASAILYALYQMDMKNQDNLFYAASYAVNAEDYDNALKYYQELKTLNYSGEGVIYYASNKANNAEESFVTKVQRDSFIKAGSHIKPRDEKIASKRGEIYKNIALILVAKNKNEEAKQAFRDARKANPEDTSLIINEANLYMTLNDMNTYTGLVNEALAKEPNNPDLLFNLGVVSADSGKLDIADGYYQKAIAADANYFNAYLNLAELRMRADEKYVNEINKLGTTDKELKRYEVLKAERNKNFMTILPILEKAVELQPENEDAKRSLMSLYNALEMTDKYKALKAQLKKE